MSNLANATNFARTLTMFSRSKHVLLTSSQKKETARN